MPIEYVPTIIEKDLEYRAIRDLLRRRQIEAMQKNPAYRARSISDYILACAQTADEIRRAYMMAYSSGRLSDQGFLDYCEYLENELRRHGTEMLGFDPWEQSRGISPDSFASAPASPQGSVSQ
jgi:hypothetical protein